AVQFDTSRQVFRVASKGHGVRLLEYASLINVVPSPIVEEREMGKASKRKKLEKQQEWFALHHDGRSEEEQREARAMLDALQKKLTDDALREDGYYFLDGVFVDSRRYRASAGMQSQSFVGHVRRVCCARFLNCRVLAQGDGTSEHSVRIQGTIALLVTFGVDKVAVWDVKTGEALGAQDVSSFNAQSIRGDAFEDVNGNIRVIYATHRQPVMQTFDRNTRAFSNLEVAVRGEFGHEQQVSCVAVSHTTKWVATGAWDSTCMLWTSLDLQLLHVFPAHEEGVTWVQFACDDSVLVTCGGTEVKLWDLQDVDAPTTMASQRLRRDWADALPYAFSMSTTFSLLAVSNQLEHMVPNHDWIFPREGSRDLELLLPLYREEIHELSARVAATARAAEDCGSSSANTKIADEALEESEPGTHSEDPTKNEESESSKVVELQSKGTPAAASVVANERVELSNESHTPRKEQEPKEEQKDADKKKNEIENPSTGDEKSREEAEPVDEVEELCRQYALMDHFDFCRLLDPSAILHEPGQVNTTIRWQRLERLDGGRLLARFNDRNQMNQYAAHTGAITCCAVAKELDLVVTVGLDAMIKFWSLGQREVLFTHRNAHTAPIMCCAFTSPSTCHEEMLLATGAKDNLVKVWRRANDGTSIECVYSMAGHFDVVLGCVFDPSGTFVISSGQDACVSMWRVRPSCPDAPDAPVVTHADRFAITLTWKEPLANGAQLVHYIIHTTQVSSFGNSPLLAVPDAQVPAKYKFKTIENLQPGTQYAFRVSAVNKIGSSPMSESCAPVETMAFNPSRIDKPAQFTDRTPTSLRLYWREPCANGAHIFSYTIRCIPENDVFVPTLELAVPIEQLEPYTFKSETPTRPSKLRAKKETAAVAAALSFPSYVITGMWPGEVYQFVVAAENRCGLADFSPFSDYIRMESTAPDPPTTPSIGDIQKRQVMIEWNKPRCNGSDVVQYTLRWIQLEPVVGGPTETLEEGRGITFDDAQVTDLIDEKAVHDVALLSTAITDTRYTLKGLEPGQLLVVWVNAANMINNKLCESAFSPPASVIKTWCDVPDVLERPALLNPSSHTLTLSFRPPKANGCPIEKYRVVLSSEEEQFGIVTKRVVREIELVPDEVPDYTFVIPKLRGKMFYSVIMAASNRVGSSEPSQSSVPVTTKPPTVPAAIEDAPIISGIEPTRVHVAWGIPEHDGGAPLQSFNLQYSIDDGEFGHDTAVYHGGGLLVENIRPKHRYCFRVATSNSAGRSLFSPPSVSFDTPSLVDYTINTYFANRPQIEHDNARKIQRRYRYWKKSMAERDTFNAALRIMLRLEWNLLAEMENAPAPPPLLQRAGRVSPGNIRSLILEKEKELHDINEYRIRTLEGLLREKEVTANAIKQKFNKLQEDFKYNLKLLEGRDEELSMYDTNFASLKTMLRDREAEISELKAHMADLQVDLKQEKQRGQEQEAYFQQKLKEARAQMEGARWNFDDEMRRKQEEMENLRRKVERQLREKEDDLETQRREITITFDEAMRQRDNEFKQAMDEAQNTNRDLELKVKSLQRELDSTKERNGELKLKLENMQQVLSESEKEVKSVEWQLADVRSTKDAKINELEEEIVKLQEVKQALLDEYEGKMAELLQSLHSVERAFTQQKSQYEEELDRQLRRKEEESKSHMAKAEGKIDSLQQKLRQAEEKLEHAHSEIKNIKWETDDKVMEKEREIDALKNEMQDLEDQKQQQIQEYKNQLWNAEKEVQTLQEKLKDASNQLQTQREKEKVLRQDMIEGMEKLEDMKRELVTQNLRWENKWQDQEQDIALKHELRLREAQQAKDRLLTDKQAAEERLMHAETELQRLRSEVYTLKADARIAESFGAQYYATNAQSNRSVNKSSDSKHRDGPQTGASAPSPLWSEDQGTLSPLAEVSPLLTDSPKSHTQTYGAQSQSADLMTENLRLKDLIRQMKEALADQAKKITNSNENMDMENDARLECARLREKLDELQNKYRESLKDRDGGRELLEMQQRSMRLEAELTSCRAQLVDANDIIRQRETRIRELEEEIEQLKQLQSEPSLESDSAIKTTEIAELKRKLNAAHLDIDRFVKERGKLMELSNQLSADLRKLKEKTNSGDHSQQRDEFTGKKDYENLIAELSHSLDEAHVYNKTLKKELRRMLKLQAMQAHDPRTRSESVGSHANSVASEDRGPSKRRSTLSMMQSLQAIPSNSTSEKRMSNASSISRSSQAKSGSNLDEDLMEMVRSRLDSTSPIRPNTAVASRNPAAPKQNRAGQSSLAAVPPSIPEEDSSQADENSTVRSDDSHGRRTSQTRPSETPLASLFNRERLDSVSSHDGQAKVSDARLRLQQAKEMLVLAGKTAERTSSLSAFAAAAQIPHKSSERETESQKTVVKKLKQLQLKRAEMVKERQKVRNYSQPDP
ncbi:TPA: LOW QUALITY PROTEIN: hypothetical protein N0F65_008063, partial [Lagenidium giganteum]